MKKKLSVKGIKLLKRLEGLRLQSYQDSGGVWTIGYGSTKDVIEGMEITEKEAEALLKKDLKRFERAVNHFTFLHQNKFDALVCFSYNIGVTAFKNSTLYKKLSTGERGHGIVFQIKRWVYVNSVRNKGLVKRRNAESCAFLSANYNR